MPRIKIDLPEKFSFRTLIPVRIQDVNYGGHVGNDAVLSILHEARMQYLKRLGCSELEAEGVSMIMADVAIVYKGEGFHGDIFETELAAGDFTTRGFDLFYKVSATREDGVRRSIAEAKTDMLCFDYRSGKVVSLPDALKEKLSR